MLEKLRKMPLSTKKKLVAICAGSITLGIFGGWILQTTSTFSSVFQSASTEGVALFSFVEQNVQNAYDAFQKNVPSIEDSFTMTTTEGLDNIEASSTEITSTTTISN